MQRQAHRAAVGRRSAGLVSGIHAVDQSATVGPSDPGGQRTSSPERGLMALLEAIQAIDADRPTDIGERIQLMVTLNPCADLAHSVARELSMGLARELESGGMKAESFGRSPTERKPQAPRRWDNSKLLARVIEYAEDQGA